MTSLSRLSYGAIREEERTSGSTDSRNSRSQLWTRWEVKATAVFALAVALCGWATIGRGKERGTQPAAPVGWQEQQPLNGETLTAFSQDLILPEERSSADGELRTTLRVAPTVARAGPLAPALNVRSYEGSVPGPTLRIRPGDRLVINLVNALSSPEGAPNIGDDDDNGAEKGGGREGMALEGKVEAWPNATNIHVHGLHVSPSGVGDNIYRRAGPGDALEYVYDLPADHYPGTFYYHPHFEGSSSVQTLGGMSGAIIVEDPEGTMPQELEAMREMVMVIQETNIESGSLRNYKAASRIAGSEMPLYGRNQNEQKDKGEDMPLLHFVTVNGQYQPLLQAQPGEAMRARFVHGGNNDHMYLSLVPSSSSSSSASASASASSKNNSTTERGHEHDHTEKLSEQDGCTLLTLARDGVYLPAPRRQGGGRGRLVLAPGSRADVAVLCKSPGVYRLVSSKGDDGAGDTPMAYLGQKTDVYEGTLAFLDVAGDAVEMKLPTQSPTTFGADRLLQPLKDLPQNEVSRFVFEFNEGEKVSHLDQTYTWYGVNGMQYGGGASVPRRVPLESVEEWVIVNQRLGRGEGATGCGRPRGDDSWEVDDAGLAATTQEGEGNGRGGLRRRRVLEESTDKEEDGEGGKGEMASDGGTGKEEVVDCARGGGGEVTHDGHPFHLHVNHFQVVSSSWGDEGPDWNVGDWRDTISIPAPGNVTVRWRADDFTGEAVAHCHIFGHSDTGMMMNFEVFANEN